MYKLAIDIGTTTVHMILFHSSFEVSASGSNPQGQFGADVLSRIKKALSGQDLVMTLILRAEVRGMIIKLCEKSKINTFNINQVVITGNTTMLYSLTGHNMESLARAPFIADYLFGVYIPAESIDIGVSPNAQIYLPPCVGAFIGADAMTGAFACGMASADEGKASLLVDVGTNGEMLLMHDHILYCTSAAAGPAFENSRLSYGSDAISLIATMLRLGILDQNGYLENTFSATDGVNISMSDIHQIQLAKGAIRAGIEVLIETAGLNLSEIDTFYLGGTFGNHLSIADAVQIGLIPHEFAKITRFMGNSALKGAALLLDDENNIAACEGMTQKTRMIQLADCPLFASKFMEYMLF